MGCPSRWRRAAPNSFRRSGRRAFRSSDGRRLPATPQKPLRADEPVKQNGELTPRRVTAGGRHSREESRPPSVRGQLPSAAAAQLGCHSVVGPQRWAMSSEVGLSGRRRPRANPIRTGSGVCRTATWRARCPTRTSPGRGRRVCPSSPCSSSAGPVVRWLSAFPPSPGGIGPGHNTQLCRRSLGRPNSSFFGRNWAGTRC